MDVYNRTIQELSYARNNFASFNIKSTSKQIQNKVHNCLALSQQTNRNAKENTWFHYNLSLLAEQAKENAEIKEALFYIFLPYIITSACKVFFGQLSRFYPRVEISDTFQQACETFDECVMNYNKTIASFSYYISKCYRLKLLQKIEPEIEYLKLVSVRMSTNSETVDKIIGGQWSLLNQLIAKDLVLEIKKATDAYKERSKRVKKKDTVAQVCDNIIYGTKTCAEVAKELGTTYHAIHAIRNNIYKMIADVINHNEHCAYAVTFTSKSNKVFQVNERIDYFTPVDIRGVRCSYCGKGNTVLAFKKESRVKGYWSCTKCGEKNYHTRSKIA